MGFGQTHYNYTDRRRKYPPRKTEAKRTSYCFTAKQKRQPQNMYLFLVHGVIQYRLNFVWRNDASRELCLSVRT